MFGLFLWGQLDGLSLIALLIPGGFGLPILLGKPQGVFLTILTRLNVKSVSLTVVVALLSVVIWRFWWQQIIGYRPDQTVNLSLFPYSVPVGIALLYYGWQRKSDTLLALASLCFSPYFMVTSMLVAITSLIRDTNKWWQWVLIVVISWAYMLGMWARLL